MIKAIKNKLCELVCKYLELLDVFAIMNADAKKRLKKINNACS
jgi:hypothetical protein